jgi:uncharacterized protein (TIGR00252 family)
MRKPDKTATERGNQAEDIAAEYLAAQGYEIVDRNWRTRWCETDIVVQKDGIIHFVEVKYRRSSSAGSGLDYITPSKLKQMAFAAEFWVNQNKWEGEYVLSAIELSGEPPVVKTFINEV